LIAYPKPFAIKDWDPIENAKMITQLVGQLPYVYLSNHTKEAELKLPSYFKSSVRIAEMVIKVYLCNQVILQKQITEFHLREICKNIWNSFKYSLMPFGMAVGIIAAQSLSEPLTQFMLNSKHRTGIGGDKTNPIIRFKEIIKAKPGDKMKTITSLINVDDRYKKDKNWIIQKCNFIELMEVNRFIEAAQIFYEKYGEPTHPDYQHERQMIKDFERRNAGINIPIDLSHWVIRLEANLDEMLLRVMNIETLIMCLRQNNNIFVVHNQSNQKNIIIRIYIRNQYFKNTFNSDARIWLKAVNELLDRILATPIRGIPGIKRAYPREISESVVRPDGSIAKETCYAIGTTGSNLAKILEIPEINSLTTQNDDILEIEEMFGIEAARIKIIYELQYIHANNITTHCSIYADEMTWTGHITNIERKGLGIREKTNVLLRMSFQNPTKVLCEAALEAYTNPITGITAPLTLGRAPSIGTTYSKVIINRDFVKKNKKSLDTELDELE
jgi:DNA-directed RNA polymerase II subunit RPB1